MHHSEDEMYGSDVFKPQWDFIEGLLERGVIVAPRKVEVELKKWCTEIPEMTAWLKKNAHIFVDMSSEQLIASKPILAEYEVYGTTENYVGDLSVISLAKCMGIAVLSLEGKKPQNSYRRPKIPNVCDEFKVDCYSVTGFLRQEKFGK
jgi:hypothetical protein